MFREEKLEKLSFGSYILFNYLLIFVLYKYLLSWYYILNFYLDIGVVVLNMIEKDFVLWV